MPPITGTSTIDACHTPHYAAGYLFRQVQPRLAMVTHLQYDESLIPEMMAGMGEHQLTIRDYLRHSNLIVTNNIYKREPPRKR